MHYAHTQGVLHRDLKPSNVLLEPLPPSAVADDAANCPIPFVPKVTDFGLAKVNDLAGDETRTGAMLGTPAYMAPEQAEGRVDQIDVRSDVYGLGAILYELLEGRAPFAGNSDADTLRRVLTDEPRFTGAGTRGVSADLAAICLKCLEKRPESRYASCGELGDDLRRYLAGESTCARPLSKPQQLWKWSRRRPALAALVAVSILAVATIVGGSAVYSRQLLVALAASDAARQEAERQRQSAEASRNEAQHARDANEQFAYAGRMRQAFHTLEMGDVQQVARLLDWYGGDTPYSGLRGFEWQYLQRASHAERMMLRGHVGEVYGVAFSPDGKILISGGQDGTIRLWDPHTGAPVRVIRAHGSCTNDLHFSPDGRLLASSSCDHTVKLWDTATWSEKLTFNGHHDDVLCVRLSPDGKRVASGDSAGVIQIWASANGEPLTTLRVSDRRTAVNAIEWSPDGRKLATPSAALHIWDTESWALRRTEDDRGVTIAFSRDGQQLATMVGRTAEIRDVTTLDRVDGFGAAAIGTVFKVAYFDGDRRLLSCGDDRMVHVVDLAARDQRKPFANDPDGQPLHSEVRTLIGHTARLQGLAIAPDGHTLATASFDGSVGLWDLNARGGPVPVITTIAGSTIGRRPEVALDKELNRLAVLGDDGRMETWDIGESRRISSQQLTHGDDEKAILSPVPEMFAVRGGKSTALLFGQTQRPDSLVACAKRFDELFQIVFSGDGAFVVTGNVDGVLRVFGTSDGKERFVFSAETEDFAVARFRGEAVLALSNDGRRLAVTNVASAIVELATGERIPLPSIEGRVTNIHFSADDRLLTAICSPGFVYLIDGRTGAALHMLHPPSMPTAAVCSLDSKTLAVATKGQVALWHVATGQEIGSLPLNTDGAVIALQFAADGRKLAAVVDDDASHELSLFIW